MRKRLTDKTVKSLSTELRQEDIWDIPGLRGCSFGVRVTSTGKKTWQVMYRDPGGRKKRVKLGTYPPMSLEKARAEAVKALAELNAGEVPTAAKPQESTFEDLADDFMRVHPKARGLRPATVREYQRILNVNLLPRFGAYPPRAIRRGDVVAYLAELAVRAPSLANRCRVLLSVVLGFGVEREVLDYNVVTGTKPPARETPREDVLTADAIRALWEDLEGREEPTASVFRVILATGQRPGEVSRMRWEDIDGDVWVLPPELTKNRRRHAVPVTSLVREILEKLPRPSEWAFGADRPPLWLHSMVRRINAAAAKKAAENGAEPWRFTAHMLRRTAATNIAALGVPRDTIAAVLNHKSADNTVTAVYDRYDKLAEKRRALQKWDDKLRRILAGEVGKVVSIR